MGFLDRAFREASKGIGALAGGLGRVFGGIADIAIPAIGAGIVGGISQRVAATIGGGGGRITGFNPDPRAQRQLDVFLGVPGLPGPSLPTGIPFSREEMVMPTFLPGGAQVTQAGFAPAIGGALGRLLPGIAGGLAAGGLFGGLFEGGVDLPTAPGVAPGGVFQVVGPTLRARSLFHITNPSTGREVWYRNVGQPVLFSGDLRTVKRVRRIAGFARRAVSRKR